MAFKPKTREWWMAVGGSKCQYEYYTEEKGFVDCGKPADEVHHIRGEAETILAGDDPERNIGMPLCIKHHCKNQAPDSEMEREFSWHPDVGEAYSRYRNWKAQETHMNEITGRRTINYSTSPFAEVSRIHQRMAEEDERYIAGTPEMDAYYEQKMTDLATSYVARTGNKKPKTAPHPKYNPKHKTHWGTGLF